jgi:four helix bundle protein
MTDFDKNDLQKRLFQFAVDLILLTRKLPKGKEYDVINYQLTKSSTSSGANYKEAQAGVSKATFPIKLAYH